MSTVDVVIPCYNYARYLPDCVKSVVTQAGVDVRVLVIDDASTDYTATIGHALASGDRRIEFRRHKRNLGHLATYNEGLLGWSSGDYTVLLSADDLLAPGALGRAVAIMNANRSVGMVYGRAITFHDETGPPPFSVGTHTVRHFRGCEWLEIRCRAGHNVICSPEVVVRGSIQRSVGGYRPELPHAGDLEMWLRIAAVSDIAYVVRAPQAFYRVHQASMLRTHYRGGLIDLDQRRTAFESFFQYHRDMPAAERLHNLARVALAREALWDACRAYDRNELEEAGAAELLQFALATYADAVSLPEYGALRRRQRLGPAICHRAQVFAASALVRKAGRWYAKQHWKRCGV